MLQRQRGRVWWGAGAAVAAVGWGAQQFAPLLLMYRAELGVSGPTVQAVFAVYVVGLIPGLLFGGPVSDRYGRRPVVLAALAASLAASALLLAGGHGVVWLFAGRLVAGFASGAGFSAGAAWVRELSAGTVDGGERGPRRATVAMTAGFGLGPLVAGVLAQWAPARTVLPYLPHLLLALAALPLVRRTPETRSPVAGGGSLRLPDLSSRRFRTVVAPLAPWVFGTVAVGIAYLPGLVAPRLGGYVLIFCTLITLLGAAAGIAVVPLARRVARAGSRRLLATALSIVVVGLLVAALAAATTDPLLVVAADLVLGAAYGCCQVCGLTEVQRIARPGQLAGLTAAYQAISYLGLAAAVPLAAADHVVPPGVLLLGLAALAALTLAVTSHAERSTGA
ncbi:MFS transporter [Pseudonocardia hierapolitana]|uniref:MFS transporter n=1 Tax=Pseudonocardia hierapolitana TaxID=1128676 RepID=A0A561SLV8_9PSEU|nr:MFS transporter [Pseudonocardia hierapolitana]